MRNSNVKKIVLATASGAAMIVSSFAQSRVGFFNSSASFILLVNDDTGASTRIFGSAGTFDIGLYMGSAGTTSLSGMQLVALASSPATVATSFNAGLFAYTGGSVTSPGNVANTLDFEAGTQYAFYVAGWAAFGGSDYLTSLASGAPNGLSSLGYITPVTGTTPIPNVFGTNPGEILGFGIFGPEPSTLALGGLGVAVLLLFRRRK